MTIAEEETMNEHFHLPTEFSPRQLAVIRELVAREQSRHGAMDARGQELHNLNRKIQSYLDTAAAAALPRAS